MAEEKKSRAKTVILIVVVIIVLIALWILIPNIPRLMFPEEEENNEELSPQEYEMFVGTNTTVYKNDILNVTITYKFGPYWDDTIYEAEWIDKLGESIIVKATTLTDLYNEILGEAQGLLSDQIKWFEYMINEELIK